MKRKNNALLLMVLLLLVGITSLFVSGTYAKYTAQITGNGTAKVAKWAFDTENAITTININLTETPDPTTLVANRIAPGTSGSFEIALTNANSEVGVDFTLSLDTIANIPTNLKFYKDNSYTTEIVPGTTEVTGQIEAEDGTGVNVPIYWRWLYETGTVTDGIATGDGDDTTAGTAANTLTIPVKIKGVQTTPNTTAITTHVN